MYDLLKLKQPTRLAALVIALCYFWLSAATSFQHTHGIEDESEEAIVVSVSAPTAVLRGNGAATGHTLKAVKITHPTRCLACEWQATNVSPALPILKWDFTPPMTPRAITTMPRYLRARTLATSSRGPPAV